MSVLRENASFSRRRSQTINNCDTRTYTCTSVDSKLGEDGTNFKFHTHNTHSLTHTCTYKYTHTHTHTHTHMHSGSTTTGLPRDCPDQLHRHRATSGTTSSHGFKLTLPTRPKPLHLSALSAYCPGGSRTLPDQVKTAADKTEQGLPTAGHMNPLTLSFKGGSATTDHPNPSPLIPEADLLCWFWNLPPANHSIPQKCALATERRKSSLSYWCPEHWSGIGVSGSPL